VLNFPQPVTVLPTARVPTTRRSPGVYSKSARAIPLSTPPSSDPGRGASFAPVSLRRRQDFSPPWTSVEHVEIPKGK
jgi:hypothetical protein